MYEDFRSIFNNHAELIAYLAIFSVFVIVSSILIIPKVITRLPADYFAHYKQSTHNQDFSFKNSLISLARNITGIILFIAGVLMLVLPGQGLLTIILGILLMDFPGKHAIAIYLLKKPLILNSLNWFRRKKNVPDLYIE